MRAGAVLYLCCKFRGVLYLCILLDVKSCPRPAQDNACEIIGIASNAAQPVVVPFTAESEGPSCGQVVLGSTLTLGKREPVRPFDAQLAAASDRRSLGMYDARFHSANWCVLLHAGTTGGHAVGRCPPRVHLTCFHHDTTSLSHRLPIYTYCLHCSLLASIIKCTTERPWSPIFMQSKQVVPAGMRG
jgi:hypothetical protein